MARQSNVKALQSLQLVNLPVDSKSNSTGEDRSVILGKLHVVYGKVDNGTIDIGLLNIHLKLNIYTKCIF
jgi:hypothetical protein